MPVIETHEEKNTHDQPGPIWLAQRHAKEGAKFSDIEIIHHEQGA